MKNRLEEALSPYLRQHADNPVHWQPWDDMALAQAKHEDKVILLSIGYAACHWCHVMAHESFEDEATAKEMNENFICIKIDREERPDLDRIYQAAHYVFHQRAGGWPLTMFLTPKGMPFFGGTYFPKTEGRGLPSFVSVLHKVLEAWRDKRAEINVQNSQVLSLLRQLDQYKLVDSAMDDLPVRDALRLFGGIIDMERGGFRGAPKFPHPVEFGFCLTAATALADTKALAAIKISCEKIATGGLCDHVGGGYFRYCVDEQWAIPHFEKMLYDNGLLLSLFVDAGIAFDSPALLQTAENIAEWALQEMQSTSGGFYASLDADSAGGEGAFYAWNEGEIEKTLSAKEYAVVGAHFGLAAGANFEGKWHLAKRQTLSQTATALSLGEDDCKTMLMTARKKLYDVRALRLPPPTDDKILTAWNGLMISGLARAGRVLKRQEWVNAAAKALGFVNAEMIVNNRLLAVRRGEQQGGLAFLDDCAFMLEAALELLRADFNVRTLNFARDMARQLLEHFEDKDNGGFFFTPADGESLIRRPKSIDDNAIPSGNGVAARNLFLLSWLTGEVEWAQAGERALSTFSDSIKKQPVGCASLLLALRWHLSPPSLVFLCGDKDICLQWQQQLEADYNPDRLVFILPQDRADLPLSLQKESPQEGARGYICNGVSCLPPMDKLAGLSSFFVK
ncbi:MAG: thioredoxin domain-containing protein [Gammaproteobacteria bacterium WSBS_2016_MAG_OTU1]